MDKDQNSLHSASRLNKKDKQRKANKIYNILIIAVSLLIVVVAATIILGDSGEPRTETASSENKSAKQKDGKSSSDNESTTDETEDASAEEENQDEEPVTEDETEAEEETDSGEPKVGEPVGTTQTGKKQSTSFEKGSADWNEMTTAMAAGTGIDQNNMTIWWLGNGGSPTTAKGTVSAKDGSQKYQVQLEWVDGKGWSPVKVEETN
ncbi:YrrS family protein [Bacillus sp. V59.32b]|uniref:YrrS family protein n=1 Tax=Bacillus sp. V59.32b TaxID=1758642 RepID=UPI001357A575|nr:YrrS family protein [Bacillus sp. V59.32b]